MILTGIGETDQDHLGGGLFIAAEFFQAKGQLLMREGVSTGEVHGSLEGVECLLRLFLLEQQHAEIEIGL